MHKLNEESPELMKTVTKYYKNMFLGLVLLAVSGCTTTGPKQIWPTVNFTCVIASQ